VPVLIFLYFLLVGFLALLMQMILPGIFPLLNAIGLGSALIPLLIIYVSLELGDERALLLAAILGLLLDLASTNHLGNSVLVLVSLSALIATQSERRESHTWPFRLLFVLVGTFAFYLLSYVLILAETARWYWPLAVWSKIVFASLLNLALCPACFLLAGLPLRLIGWRPRYETQDRFGTYAR
jgi:rod shape-determining protein MreD